MAVVPPALQVIDERVILESLLDPSEAEAR